MDRVLQSLEKLSHFLRQNRAKLSPDLEKALKIAAIKATINRFFLQNYREIIIKINNFDRVKITFCISVIHFILVPAPLKFLFSSKTYWS